MFQQPAELPTESLAVRPARIGVLTFHRCINYGSYWQARCLVDGLRQRGHDAVLLDHIDPSIERTEWRSALQPLLPQRSSRGDMRLYARKVRRFCEAQNGLPLSAPFPLDRPEQMASCDMVIVGSDEVWNFTHPWYAARALFFGDGVPAPRTAAYAASFGNYDASAGIDPHWATHLRQFDSIAVRDENSQRLVKAATGVEPPLVLDPCLQFPPAIEMPNQGGPADYAVVYGHSFPAPFGGLAREWAARRGVRLVSVGYRNAWADANLLDAGPLDFARLIARSAAVLTNFFHGCVFALLNARPFACSVSPYRMNKVRDLTNALGAQKHLLGPDHGAAQLDTALEAPPDAAIAAAITRMRSRSDAYLQSVLA